MMGAAGTADEALRHIQYMVKALGDTPRADPKLGADVRAIEKRLRAARRPAGDPVVAGGRKPRPVHHGPRGGQLGSTSPITATVKDYEIAAAGFERRLGRRGPCRSRSEELGDRLEAAGAPWTPGRGLPTWKK